MPPAWKAKWLEARAKAKELLRREPGTRFQAFYEEQRHAPVWLRAIYIGLALVALVVGVVLAFIPGPAVLFFAIAAALTATQSAWVARVLDRVECKLRAWFTAARDWWRRRRDGGRSAGASRAA